MARIKLPSPKPAGLSKAFEKAVAGKMTRKPSPGKALPLHRFMKETKMLPMQPLPMRDSIPGKMTGKNPAGRYFVENSKQQIGPYQTKAHATGRLRTEQTVASEGGNRGKSPELIFVPRGIKRKPAGSNLRRVSANANTGNGPQSKGFDYQTQRAVKNDTPAQRKKAPRGYYTGPGAKNGL